MDKIWYNTKHRDSVRNGLKEFRVEKKILDGLVIIVLAFFMIAVNVSNLYLTRNVEKLSNNLKIIVLLKGELQSVDTQSFVDQIGEMYGVTSADFISSADILKGLEENIGTQFNYLNNPFSDQIIVVVKPGIDVKELAATIESSDYVQACDYDGNYLAKTSGLIAIENRFSRALLWMGNIGIFLCMVWATRRASERRRFSLQEEDEESRALGAIKMGLMWIIGIVVAFGILFIINKYIFQGGAEFLGGKPFTLGESIKASYLPLVVSGLLAIATLLVGSRE